MKRPEAWKEGLKRIEAGERGTRTTHNRWRSDPEFRDHQYRRWAAQDAAIWLGRFAVRLERTGYEATAVEVRRFMYDVIEPHTGRQCQ